MTATINPVVIILDVSDNITLFEGRMTERMFATSGAKVELYHVPSLDWSKIMEKIQFYRSSNEHALGIVITGSYSCVLDPLDWLPPIEQLIRECVVFDHADNTRGDLTIVPVLGICFGAQLIAKVVYGKEAINTMVGEGLQGEFGYKEVVLSEDGGVQSAIFKGLPNRFMSIVSHNDCFRHERLVPIASTKQWKNHAFEVKSVLMNNRVCCWALQFHPEIQVDDFNGIVCSQNLAPEKVIHDGDTSVEDYTIRTRIASNFVEQMLAIKQEQLLQQHQQQQQHEHY
eukprot:GEZU01027756.1.p1 GENE.GEZU01027756.1~~GEZU01027756.1.p1  ORF type:complete len:302 (-),score=62.88 GEZU01027756.1:181-1035(-)